MVLIRLPLPRILKLSLLKIGFPFPLHLVVLPLALVVGSILFELITTLSMLRVSFLLPYILTSDILVINFMYSIHILPVLFLPSQTTSQHAVVPAVYWHVWVVRADVRSIQWPSWTDVRPIHWASRTAPHSPRVPASTCALTDAPWVVPQVDRVGPGDRQIYLGTLTCISAYQERRYFGLQLLKTQSLPVVNLKHISQKSLHYGSVLLACNQNPVLNLVKVHLFLIIMIGLTAARHYAQIKDWHPKRKYTRPWINRLFLPVQIPLKLLRR